MTWVIVGLGNPGEEYEGTRHNAGRAVVEEFARILDASPWQDEKMFKARISKAMLGQELIIMCEPQTFMNRSSAAVIRLVKTPEEVERLIVVYDDLDLPQGSIKVSYDRSAGGHKGVESIIRGVKTKKFVRVRIGISPTTPDGVMQKPKGAEEVDSFVLSRFRQSELAAMEPSFKRAAEAVRTIIGEGPETAMGRFN